MFNLTNADRRAMYLAKNFLNVNEDSMAVYVLRDTHVIERLGFRELFWAMYREGTCVREMEYVLELLVKELDKFD